MLAYLALRVLSLVVPLLPPWLGYPLARLFGEISFLAMRRVRERVLANLRIVLGEEAADGEVRRTARSVFRTSAQNYYDLFRVPRIDMQRFKENLHTVGWEQVDEARRLGKGVIVVVPHMGNLDVVANVSVVHGVPCTIPTENLRSAKALRLITEMRASQGVHIVPLDGRGALRDLYRALGENRLIGIVGDRDLQGRGIPLPFFGKIANIPTGAVNLALRTGAPLLAGRSLRGSKPGTYHMFVSPPLSIPRTGSKDDLRAGTAIVAAALERFIRDAPGQWIVFERFWPLENRAGAGEPIAAIAGHH